MMSLIFSSGGGALLGLIIRSAKMWLSWKKTKAELALLKTALDQEKAIPELDIGGLSTQNKNVVRSKKHIFWLFNKRFGSEYEKINKDSAWNPVSDARGVLAHAVVWTVCGIASLWAVFPKAIIHTLNYGDDSGISFLWGLIKWPVSPGIIEVSSGSIVFGLLHLLTFIITCYFVQRD